MKILFGIYFSSYFCIIGEATLLDLCWLFIGTPLPLIYKAHFVALTSIIFHPLTLWCFSLVTWHYIYFCGYAFIPH